jgi:hypothetical protein
MPNRLLRVAVLGLALLGASGGAALGQSECEVRIEGCEDRCPVIIDPSSIGTGFTTVMDDPECLARCDSLCIPSGSVPAACSSLDSCQSACPVIIDPASTDTGFVTVTQDPECLAACQRQC